jgi:hypothetical protein
MKRRTWLPYLSEKQYQVAAGLARNCRFFFANDPALGKTLSLAFQMLCSEPRHELDDSESKLPLGKAHRLSISAAFSASSSSI